MPAGLEFNIRGIALVARGAPRNHRPSQWDAMACGQWRNRPSCARTAKKASGIRTGCRSLPRTVSRPIMATREAPDPARGGLVRRIPHARAGPSHTRTGRGRLPAGRSRRWPRPAARLQRKSYRSGNGFPVKLTQPSDAYRTPESRGFGNSRTVLGVRRGSAGGTSVATSCGGACRLRPGSPTPGGRRTLCERR